MNKDFYNRINELGSSNTLVHHDYLFALADKTAGILESECALWRPLSSSNQIGGFLDFTNPKLEQLPTIVVPDLHARAFFISNLLNYSLTADFLCCEKSMTVLEALEQNKIRIICVGDLLHSELRCKDRWIGAQEEFLSGVYNGPNMMQEMIESLNLLALVMELKCAFPQNFHILKGNHENIMNVRSPGNFPFRKFANEGEMVRIFMEKEFGDDVTMVIFCFENALPLLAALPQAIVSHAEPARAFSRDEVINGMNDDQVILGLTWTENNAAQEGSVPQMLKELLPPKEGIVPRYLGGHRPVKRMYLLRQEGSYVQIHNPQKQHIALLYKNKSFNPDTDIVDIEQKIVLE